MLPVFVHSYVRKYLYKKTRRNDTPLKSFIMVYVSWCIFLSANNVIKKMTPYDDGRWLCARMSACVCTRETNLHSEERLNNHG